MATVRIALACTGMPGSIAGAEITTNTSACFNAANLNNAAHPTRTMDADRAASFINDNGLAEVIWDMEDAPWNGQPLDFRSAHRRKVRNNLKRVKAFLEQVQNEQPGCAQYVYRSFPANLSAAASYSSAQRARWLASATEMKAGFGEVPTAASTDLYMFASMATWSQAQMNAAVDANILAMQEVHPTGRLLVYVCAENHPGGASPWSPVNATRFGWLNSRLATYPRVDPVLWGGIANGPPNVPSFSYQAWATYSAAAQYAAFKAAWGMP